VTALLTVACLNTLAAVYPEYIRKLDSGGFFSISLNFDYEN